MLQHIAARRRRNRWEPDADAVIRRRYPMPRRRKPAPTREKEEEGGREEKGSGGGEGPTLYPTLKKVLGSRRRRRKNHWDPDAETVGRRYLARL
jgi:hypothetical protein